MHFSNMCYTLVKMLNSKIWNILLINVRESSIFITIQIKFKKKKNASSENCGSNMRPTKA